MTVVIPFRSLTTAILTLALARWSRPASMKPQS